MAILNDCVNVCVCVRVCVETALKIISQSGQFFYDVTFMRVL